MARQKPDFAPFTLMLNLGIPWADLREIRAGKEAVRRRLERRIEVHIQQQLKRLIHDRLEGMLSAMDWTDRVPLDADPPLVNPARRSGLREAG